MKNLTIALACVIALTLGSFTAHAQLLNVATSPDSTVVIDKVYAGVLAATSYQHDVDKFTNYTSFRVGVSGLWKVNKKLTLRSWTALDYEAVSVTSYGLTTFYLQYSPSKKLTIEAGKTGTLVAQQHRPHPVSNAGHFEAWTQAQLPGGALALQVKFNPTKKSMIGGGVSLRDDQPEYQVAGTIGQLQLSGFYQSACDIAGVGLTYNSVNGNLTNTSFYKTDAMGSFTSWMFAPKQSLGVYSDFGYSIATKKVVRCAGGLMKCFSMKYCQGAFALGYQYETKSINGYLFVTL